MGGIGIYIYIYQPDVSRSDLSSSTIEVKSYAKYFEIMILNIRMKSIQSWFVRGIIPFNMIP